MNPNNHHNPSVQIAHAPTDHAVPPQVHPSCCVQSAMNLAYLYQAVDKELQQSRLHVARFQTEVAHANAELANVHSALLRERAAAELVNQELRQLQEDQRQLDGLNQGLSMRVVEGAIEQAHFQWTHGEEKDVILDAVRTRLSVGDLSGKYDIARYEATFKELGQRYLELQSTNQALADKCGRLEVTNRDTIKQLEEKNSEIRNLQKACELASTESRRKQPRRSGKSDAVAIKTESD